MRPLRCAAVVVVASALVACGIGSDIDDYAAVAPGSTAKAGSAGAVAAGSAGVAGNASAGAAGAQMAGAGGASAGGGNAGAAGTSGQGGMTSGGSAGQPGGGTAGATSGGAGGVGGQPSGGAGGQPSGGAGGQAGASAGKGGSAGATMGLIGLACAPNDTFTCYGDAQAVVLKCTGGVWQNAISCAEGKLCDSSLASTVGDRCAPIVPACQGQPPGASVCEGADRITCGIDLVTSTKKTCGSAALCALGTGPNCAGCEPGTFSCNGAQLSRCNAQLQPEPMTTCASAAQCNAASGACTAAVCVAGTFSCQGSTLKKCDPMGATYVTVADCTGTLCDAANGQCDVCQASIQSCADVNTRSTCSDDGQTAKAFPCAPESPYCVGAGTCVACRTSFDCPLPSSQCMARACNSGQCGLSPKPAGSTAKSLIGDCKAGVCDGQGNLQDDPEDLPADDGAFCTQPACTPGPSYVAANDGLTCAPQSVCKKGACLCVPKSKLEACQTAAVEPIICGSAPDGCGKLIACGTCPVSAPCCTASGTKCTTSATCNAM